MAPGAELHTPDLPDLERGGLFGHPKGLSTLFLTEMWERFSYYGMRALLMLFMVSPVAAGGLGFATPKAAAIYGLYTGSVYFATIPGGWMADRLLGLRRAVLIGGILIALGHYCLMLSRQLSLFFLGLVLIVLGTGLLKANVSSIVGQLYPKGDQRLDAGFSLFYMGINLGAFVSPFVCGYLGQKIGWHWGFGAAAVGMTLGLIQYVLGSARLGEAGRLKDKPKDPGRLWAGVVVVAVFLVVIFSFLWQYLVDNLNVILTVATVPLFVWLLFQARDQDERKKMGAIIVLFVFAILFWIGFEQAGSSLTLFADQKTNNVLFGYSFPSTWYQSVEPIFVISFAPVFAWLWLRMGRFEPSSPAKFAAGLIFLGTGYVPLAYAAKLSQDHLVSPWWLVVLYLFHAWGELALSPVGLSTVTKLAPERVVGLMMGVWFLALSLGNFYAGQVAGLFTSLPLPKLFGACFVSIAASGLVLLLLVRPMKGLTGDA
jgi:POT family proton-dependent oligopeptide transporter